MNETKENAHAPEPEINYPHSWKKIIVILSCVAVSLILVTVLLVQFAGSRPIVLDSVTNQSADALEQLLIRNRVPRDHITRAPAERRRFDEGTFTYHAIEVQTPPTSTIEGLTEIIRRGMADREVAVAREESDGAAITLDLAQRDLLFAQVRLEPPKEAPVAATPVPEVAAAPAPPPAIVPLNPVTGQPSSSVMEELPSIEELPMETGDEVPVKESVVTGPKRVAIVLDDGGYGGPVSDAVLSLDPRLTVAILPFAGHSRDTALKAAAQGQEVLLHMPMQATNGDIRYPGELTLEMDVIQMTIAIAIMLEQTPGAVGVNNHTGSKFTADARALRDALLAVQSRELFFLDSYTTAESKGAEVATELGVKYARRDIFLDNVLEAAAIAEQFDALIERCEAQGTAIAIGHFKQETVDALRRLIPKLATHDIALVHVSQLVQ